MLIVLPLPLSVSHANNSSVWKTPFPALLTTTHLEWLSLNMASSGKTSPDDQSGGVVLLCISKPRVSVNPRLSSIFYVLSPALSNGENTVKQGNVGRGSGNISKAILEGRSVVTG